MIKNKLLYFKTYQAYKDLYDSGQIEDTSIAFVEEGHSIYTHGVEYGGLAKIEIDQLDNKINNFVQTYNNLISSLADSLTNEAIERHNELVEQTRQDLEEAKQKLDEYKAILDSLGVDTYKQGVDELRGIVTAYAETWSVTNLTVTRLLSTLDSIQGIILTEGEYADITNQILNTYKDEVNLRLGTLEQTLRNLDIEGLVETVIGREINTPDGLLHDFATKTWVGQNLGDLTGVDITNAVETYFNTNEPSWRTFVEHVSSLEGKTLEVILTNLQLNADGLTALTTRTDENSRAIASLQTWVGLGEGGQEAGFALTALMILDVLAGEGGSSIAASIIGLVNQEGSSISINADRINLLGLTIALAIAASSINAVSLTAGTEPNKIVINNTGIKHMSGRQTSAFNILTNGTGDLAWGNLQWDAQGNLYIRGRLVGTTGSDIAGYVKEEKIGNISGTVKSYIDSSILASTSGTTQENIEAIVTSAVDSAVSDTLGGYLLKTNVSSALDAIIADTTNDSQLRIRLATAEAGISSLTSAVADEAGRIEGLESRQSSYATTSDLLTTNTMMSSLTNWAKAIPGKDSAGFDLVAFINAVKNYNPDGASNKTNVTDADISLCLKGEVFDSGQRGWSETEIANKINANANVSAVSQIKTDVEVLKSQLQDNEDSIDSIRANYALKTYVDSINTRNTQVISGLKTWADSIKGTSDVAGFSLQALIKNLTGKTSDGEAAIAEIEGYVLDGVSNINISADKIYVGSLNNTLTNELSSIKSGESIVGISADKILLSGNTTLSGKLSALDADFENLTAKSLSAVDGNKSMTINANNLQYKVGQSNSIKLNSDGTGSLANGNIYWDAQGNLYANNLMMDSTSSGFQGGNYCNMVDVKSLTLYQPYSLGDLSDYNNANILMLIQCPIIISKNGVIILYDNGTLASYPATITAFDLLVLNECALITWLWQAMLILFRKAGKLDMFASSDVVSDVYPSFAFRYLSNDNVKIDMYPSTTINKAFSNYGYSNRELDGGSNQMTISQMDSALDIVQWKYCFDLSYDLDTMPPTPDSSPSIWKDFYRYGSLNNPWIAIRYKSGSSWGSWGVTLLNDVSL